MIKNSRLALWIMIPMLVLCFIARFFQITVGTDMTSGYLYDDNGFLLDLGFYALVFLTFAAAIVMGIVDKRRNGPLFVTQPGDIVDGRAVLIGFPLLATGMLAAYEGLTEMNAITPSALRIVIDFVFGAAMVVLAFVVLYKKEITSSIGFAFIVPALYFTVRSIAVFLDRMAVETVPEYLIELIGIVGAAVFFMQLAQLLTGNEGKNTRICLIAVGAATCVMTVSSALAVIAADIAAPAEIAQRITSSSYEKELFYQSVMGNSGYMMCYVPWVQLAAAVTILCIMIAVCGGKAAGTAPDEEKSAEIGE